MRDSDPLERWAYRDDSNASPKFAAARLRIARTALDKLETYLRRPNKKSKPKISSATRPLNHS